MTFVVDTNVAIAANGRKTHADEECRLTCVEKLESLEQKVVAIDDGGLILEEYGNCLNYSGGPGVGDEFFMYVFNNQGRENRVRMVTVTPSGDSFQELPENTFDRSDRKFLAVAVVAKATVLNATDSDWNEQAELMDKLNVEVEQLCPQHAKKRTRRK